MTQFIKLFLTTLLFLACFDLLWLGVVAKNMYAQYLGYLMTDQIQWWAALCFYFLFAAGLTVFVLIPNMQQNSYLMPFLYGAFFGLIAYGTYDLTNQATIKAWPLMVTFIDMLWGALMSGTVSILVYLVWMQR